MPADFDNIIGGPAQFQLDDAPIGHTAGGITSTITPNNRMVKVDQFGESECNVRHTGDVVRLNVPFAEWIASTLLAVYNPGRDQTAGGGSGKYIGIGRSAGYIYTVKDAKIIPYLSADAAKVAQFWRTTPIGEIELAWNNEDDTIFNSELACLVDESKTDGELVGKIRQN